LAGPFTKKLRGGIGRARFVSTHVSPAVLNGRRDNGNIGAVGNERIHVLNQDEAWLALNQEPAFQTLFRSIVSGTVKYRLGYAVFIKRTPIGALLTNGDQ